MTGRAIRGSWPPDTSSTGAASRVDRLKGGASAADHRPRPRTPKPSPRPTCAVAGTGVRLAARSSARGSPATTGSALRRSSRLPCGPQFLRLGKVSQLGVDGPPAPRLSQPASKRRAAGFACRPTVCQPIRCAVVNGRGGAGFAKASRWTPPGAMSPNRGAATLPLDQPCATTGTRRRVALGARRNRATGRRRTAVQCGRQRTSRPPVALPSRVQPDPRPKTRHQRTSLSSVASASQVTAKYTEKSP